MTSVPVEVVAVAAGGGLLVVIAAGGVLLRRRRQRARIDGEEQAMAVAGAELAGFRPLAAVVGTDGAAALVSGQGGGRLALVHAGGRHLQVRDVDWNAVRATPGGIVVETGDRGIGGVPLTGIDVLHVRRLAPAPSEAAMRLAEQLGSDALSSSSRRQGFHFGGSAHVDR